jgi:MoaA/NifB/PqqE/SkfB family radical SAM enzyme
MQAKQLPLTGKQGSFFLLTSSLIGNLTDLRRGTGVFDKALDSLDRLRAAGVLTGISVTVGPQNVDYWSQAGNIDGLIAHSGPLVFFIEQIPSGPCETASLLTPEQRSRFRETVVQYRDRNTGGAYIIHSPDDEEFFGGCVSAGRGFAHVNPNGDVTACPMSALATHNLKTATLKEALASPFFEMIRSEGQLLDESEHPCGLSAHAGELEKMAKGLGAYRTGAPQAAKTG